MNEGKTKHDSRSLFDTLLEFVCQNGAEVQVSLLNTMMAGKEEGDKTSQGNLFALA
jgi:hypothetical protein